ncbi:unnamed protein product [Polarella glacialis]|uniref:Cation/H+ exchanger domain-containing protein n=1 Tax=Polarella glacialis TaxID=89957 RepID=A0A813HER1_POLGL|nr:unnamed protein product [Polarella glacialis]
MLDGQVIADVQFPKEYPVQLAIAYILLVGYLVRTLFVSLRLPAAVGVILSGFIFSYFLQADIFLERDVLQELAFFLVLLTAGLEISIKDLRPYLFVLAWFPCAMELLAIAAFSSAAMDYTFIEGLNLGIVLAAIGDGLVIPKMKEFSAHFPEHPMPHLMFRWAPLEACFALTFFGVLKGASAPACMPEINMPLLVLANITRIGASLAAGAIFGTLSGWLITYRTKASLFGHQVFTGSSVESFLMLLSVALVSYGLGGNCASGEPLVPIIFSGGSLLQPELLVIVTGSTFAAAADKHTVHHVEHILGGVWVFGQLVLFTMLGSKTSTAIFPELSRLLPIMAVGLTARFIGVSAAIVLTRRERGCEFQNPENTAHDALFCFLATVPRATIQGALGAVPVSQRYFKNFPLSEDARSFIFTAARLYIVCMSVFGMCSLNTFGPCLLRASEKRPAMEIKFLGDHDLGQELLEQLDFNGDNRASDELRVEDASTVLAEEFNLDVETVFQVHVGSSHRREGMIISAETVWRLDPCSFGCFSLFGCCSSFGVS